MEITVTELRATAGGAEAAVSVRICGGNSVQNLKGSLLAEMLAELGLPWEFTAPIVIDKDQCDELIFCIEKTAAIKKGLSLLGYAQNTAKMLKRKLAQKGYSAEAASAAVEYLLSHGFIHEKKRRAAFLGNTGETEALRQKPHQKGALRQRI